MQVRGAHSIPWLDPERLHTHCPPSPPHYQESAFITKLSPYHHRIETGFVPNMRVPGIFYVNGALRSILDDELRAYCDRGPAGGFLPAVKQIANVAALPGIVRVRRGGSQLHAPSCGTLVSVLHFCHACFNGMWRPGANGMRWDRSSLYDRPTALTLLETQLPPPILTTLSHPSPPAALHRHARRALRLWLQHRQRGRV